MARALELLLRLGARRARDLDMQPAIAAPAARAPAEPIGWHLSGALGIAGAFGALEATTLAAFARAVPANATLRPAPGRALLVLGLDAATGAMLRDQAARLGLVIDATDPRRRIAACPGRPACASALVTTRDLAEALARAPGLPAGTIHVSGCAKGCAHPAHAAITLVGCEAGLGLVRHGTARDPAQEILAPGDVVERLTRSAT